MSKAPKRDNEYWVARLRKDGHDALLARIDAGEITVYQARKLAGYLKAKPKSPAGLLSYHWKRASHDERKRFVVAHLKEVNRLVREVRDDLIETKAQKVEESDQK